MAKLTFLGAVQQVTGSCYLIQTENAKVLLECGMEQENLPVHVSQTTTFCFNPEDIDAVILSHAHLDHSGNLPVLVAKGFRGPIYMTTATSDLLNPMLNDSTFLYLKDIQWENTRRKRAGTKELEPEYSLEDLAQCLRQRESIEYRRRTRILSGIEICYQDAGHILGSAIVEIWITEKNRTRKLVFSGDLGNNNSPLMRDPAIVEDADILLLESTYGDRDHRPLKETLIEFKHALDAAVDDGGNVLIPAFAVGRTQDIIYRLGQYFQNGTLQQRRVFL
ncbi:MAG: MBL fold metallo-hydrolase, partial [Gammaproteobacteria bacterium]|nr:MBL fold metallo-hydrolase [Gammaproteobacteria bacterium]